MSANNAMGKMMTAIAQAQNPSANTNALPVRPNINMKVQDTVNSSGQTVVSGVEAPGYNGTINAVAPVNLGTRTMPDGMTFTDRRTPSMIVAAQDKVRVIEHEQYRDQAASTKVKGRAANILAGQQGALAAQGSIGSASKTLLGS